MQEKFQEQENNSLYVSKNGELTSRKKLLDEIEDLLNALPSQSRTTLSPQVMNTLGCEELESIRDSLMCKSQNQIAHNREWLLGLVDRA